MKTLALAITLILVNTGIILSQEFDIDTYLPVNKKYAEKKVKRVIFLESTGQRIIHEYDKTGRLIRLVEDEDSDIATYYQYTINNNRETCKVVRTSQPDDYQCYIMEYNDKNKLSALYQVEATPLYSSGDSASETKPGQLDSTRVLRIEISYTIGQYIASFAYAVSALKPEVILDQLATLNYKSTDTNIVQCDSTSEHSFRTTFNSKHTLYFADSVYFAAGRNTKDITFAGNVYMGSDILKNFKSVKTYTPTSGGYYVVEATSYVNKQHKLVHKKLTKTLVVENDRGLEIENYELDDKGKKTAIDVIQYEYY